jgi:hypothetical protein
MRKVAPRILAVLALLAGIGFLLSHAGNGALAQSLPSFKYDPTWPKPLPNKWKMGGVTGLAVDKDDNIWVLNRPNDLVSIEVHAEQEPPLADCCVHAPAMIQFDKAGNVIGSFDAPQGHGMGSTSRASSISGRTPSASTIPRPGRCWRPSRTSLRLPTDSRSTTIRELGG